MKDTHKKQKQKELRIERIHKLAKIEKMKTLLKELGIEIEFNELANNLDIRLIKGPKKSIPNIVEYVMEKILKRT